MKAIEGFKMLASDSTTKDPAVISKLVGVLAQLLLSQDEKEVEVVNVALCAALEKDVQATCTTLLEMMSAEPNVRIKAVGFISQELCPRANKLLNHSVDAQNAVATQIKKLMAIATAAEFKMCMKILFSLKIFQNGVEGANELLAMVTGGIDLETDFNASASDKVDLIFIMMTSAMMMFTHGAQPNKLISYICKKVMPKYEALSPAQQLNLLKVIAEISPYMRGHCCREYITTVYPLMMTLLPAEATEETKINYTAVEAVLYSFHQTASRVPGFLHSICGIKINTGQPECKIDEDHSEKLADLQKRLTVVQAQCKDFVGKLKVVAKKLDEATPEDTPEAKKELVTHPAYPSPPPHSNTPSLTLSLSDTHALFLPIPPSCSSFFLRDATSQRPHPRFPAGWQAGRVQELDLHMRARFGPVRETQGPAA